jgi:hypothetical protein
MTKRRKSIMGLATLALGGLLATVPATSARADAPSTAAEAQAKADDARKEAKWYSSLGGVGYKSGLERQANAEAARYDAKATKLAKEEAAESAPAPQSGDCVTIKQLICNP